MVQNRLVIIFQARTKYFTDWLEGSVDIDILGAPLGNGFFIL